MPRPTRPLQAAAKKAGIGFTSLAVSSTATSYTAECLQLQQEKVDYAQLNFTTAAAAKFVQDCQVAELQPDVGDLRAGRRQGPAGHPGLHRVRPGIRLPLGRPSGVRGPAFTKAMTSYAKGDNWKEGAASFTWAGLETIRAALANAGATVTSADVTGGLNALKAETLGGLAPNPLTFTTGKPVAFGAHPCSFVVGIKDGKTVAPDGLNTVCAS